MATNKLKSMKKIWKGNDVKTKLKFHRSIIFPIAIYGSETWSLTKEAEKKINAFELRCYRRILRIPYTAKRTNVSVLKEIGNVKEEWLLNFIVSQKLRFFCNIKRHYCLEKDIFEGRIEGKRGYVQSDSSPWLCWRRQRMLH